MVHDFEAWCIPRLARQLPISFTIAPHGAPVFSATIWVLGCCPEMPLVPGFGPRGTSAGIVLRVVQHRRLPVRKGRQDREVDLDLPPFARSLPWPSQMDIILVSFCVFLGRVSRVLSNGGIRLECNLGKMKGSTGAIKG